MEDWKEALWLTRYELKRSLVSYIIITLILFFSIIFTASLADSYFTEPTIGLDFFLLIVFGMLARRPDTIFLTEKLSNGHYVSPSFIGLKQLAIKKEIVVKHRFLTFICFSLPFNILFLFGLYMNSFTLHYKMSISTYLVFSVIWICFTLYIGCAAVAYESGTKLIGIIMFGTLLFSLFIVYIILFFKIYNTGLVNWTIHLATNYPILSIVISIALAIIGWNFWMNKMLNNMKRFDYL